MKIERFLKHFAFIFFVSTLLNTVLSFAGPGRTTYQAKIVKPDGYPLEASSVNFKFTILDPSATCVLYSETYSNVNMSSTSGLISFSLGSGVKTFPVSSTTFEQVFSNITPFLACDSGGPANYSPTASDMRRIVMQFNDGNGWQTLPAMSINAVPYAMYADDAMKFNGMQASDFVQVSTIPSCTASEALRYNGSSFNCVAVGGSGAVTSGAVVTAFGYTPADGASVTALSSSLATTNSNVSSVSSTIASVSSTVFSVSSTVSSLSNTVSALVSSQWLTSGTTLSYEAGNVGIGTTNPSYRLHVMKPVSGATTVGLESYDSTPGIYFLRANGTAAAPLPVSNTQSLLEIAAVGYGQTHYLNTSAAKILMSADENWSDTTGAASIRFHTRGTSTTAPSLERMRISNNGFVGIGTVSPATTLDVNGGLRIGVESSSCTASLAGTLRYSGGLVEYCNGTTWAAFGVAGAGILSINGLTSGSQTFAFGSAGTTPSASSVGTVHTFNFPYASVATTTAGLISYSDYLNFSNKLNATSSSVISALTYTPADQTTVGSSFSAVTTSITNLSASVGAIVSSQWTTAGTAIHYTSGNVGIGTTSPTSSLQISRDTTAATILVETTSATTNQYPSVTVNKYGTGGHPGLYFNSAGGTSSTPTATNTTLTRIIASGHNGVTAIQGAQIYMYPETAWSVGNTPAGMQFFTNNGTAHTEKMTIMGSGNVGIGTTTPSAKLQIAAGTSVTASLKITSGTLLTAAQDGAIEYDGTNLYYTDSTNTRRALASTGSGQTFSGTNTFTGVVNVSNNTVSTNSSTGAFIVSGGVGIGGALNVSGAIVTTSNIQGVSVTATSGMISPYIAGSTASAGTLTLDSTTHSSKGNIFLAPSGGKVGIGTISPTASLDVNGAALVQGLTVGRGGGAVVTNTAYGIAALGANTAGPYDTAIGNYAMANNLTGDENTALGYQALYSNTSTHKNTAIGSQALRSSIATGNTGVGYMNSLQLSTGSLNTSIGYRAGYNTGASMTTISNSVFVGADANASVDALTNVVAIGYQAQATQSNQVVIGNSSITQTLLRGNVGIGTASPTEKLTVYDGNVSIPYVANKTHGYKLDLGNNLAYLWRNYQYADDSFFISQNWYANDAGVDVIPNAAHTTQAIEMRRHVGVMLKTGASNTVPVARLTVDPAGSVGIGTTTPGARFHVATPASGAVNTRVVFGNSNSDLLDVTGLTGDVYLDHVVGARYTASTATTLGKAVTFKIDGPPNVASSPLTVSELLALWIPSGNVSFGGNLGVGVTSPTAALVVSKSTTVGSQIQVNNSSVNGYITVPSSGEGIILSSSRYNGSNWVTDSTGAAAVTVSDGAIQMFTNSSLTPGASHSYTERFRVDSTGNIGIGTTTPKEVLDVRGNITTVGGLMQNLYFNGAWNATVTGYGSYWSFDKTTGMQYFWNTAASATADTVQTLSARMVIDKNGNVGMGTSTPNAKLHVKGNIASDVDSTGGILGQVSVSGRNTAAATPYYTQWSIYNMKEYGPMTGLGFYEYYDANNNGILCDAGDVCASRVTFAAGGNVGIGVQNPTYLLQLVNDSAAKPGTNTWTIASDMRLKDSRGSFTRGMNELLGLDTIYFTYKKDNALGLPSDKEYVGIRAQDAQKVIPESVSVDEKGFLHFTSDAVFWTAVNAIKQLYHKLIDHDAKLEKHEREIASIKEENEMLKQQNAEKDKQLQDIRVYLCEKDPTAPICK